MVEPSWTNDQPIPPNPDVFFRARGVTPSPRRRNRWDERLCTCAAAHAVKPGPSPNGEKPRDRATGPPGFPYRLRTSCQSFSLQLQSS